MIIFILFYYDNFFLKNKNFEIKKTLTKNYFAEQIQVDKYQIRIKCSFSNKLLIFLKGIYLKNHFLTFLSSSSLNKNWIIKYSIIIYYKTKMISK